ncbi:MAG: cytochrome c1 [Acetobacteraceae bacterium]|nr:cytochrome c1 [Acetobacteraceae bacterium]
MGFLRIAAAAALLALATPVAATAAEGELTFPPQNWSFSGPFGTFDRAAAQRGFQVYSEVCAACHSVKHAYYRDLGGIGLTHKEIEAIAAAVMVPSIDDDGQPAERPARPSDHFRAPYPNETAARATFNGAYPPDLSVIIKARAGGADQLYNLLAGYAEPPADMKLGDGMYYNKYFAGHQIAMPAPLSDGRVTYADGTRASVEQMARDVTTFLAYIAEPEMEVRKRLGVKVVLFLIFMTGVTYAAKRKVWADVH